MYKIYKHTSKTSGKSYVGLTKNDVIYRLKQHYRKNKRDKLHFGYALRKYGMDDFNTEILCEVETLQEAEEKEIFFIDKYDTFNNGYNLTIGGSGSKRAKRDPIMVKNNKSRLGKKNSKEHRKKISISSTGTKKSFNSEQRKKLSIHLTKINKSRAGREVSIETRQKQSDANILSGHSKRKISADGVVYSSIMECCKELNIGKNTPCRRINSDKFPTWFYIEV